MIGKTIIGRSFKGCVDYNLKKVDRGLGKILECRGVRDFNRSIMIRDFDSRKAVNPKLTKCVWHTSLSFQDKLNNNQMLVIAKDWIAGMGLDKTQYVVLRHTDTDHPHIHIIASRINDEGKSISDSNNWKRSEMLCQELTIKFQLTPLPGERNELKIRREKLKGRDLLKTDINRVIHAVMRESKNLEDFSSSMIRKGFQCSIRFNPDQSVRGVSFERNGVKIKGSDIHKSLSGKNILAMINSNVTKNLSPELGDSKSHKNLLLPTIASALRKLDNHMDYVEDEQKKKRKRRDDQDISM